MEMGYKKLGLVCACSLVFGILGGVIGSKFLSGDSENVTFKTVTITDVLLIKAEGSEGAGCKLLPDGTATLTGGLIANQVRGQIFSGQTFLASTNPLNATLNDQMVMAQMTADPNTGGQIIARSREATLIPSRGAPTKGSMAVIAFNQQNGGPEIYTQNIAQGAAGRSFMVAARQGPAQAKSPKASGVASPEPGQPATTPPPTDTGEHRGPSRSPIRPSQDSNDSPMTGMRSTPPPL